MRTEKDSVSQYKFQFKQPQEFVAGQTLKNTAAKTSSEVMIATVNKEPLYTAADKIQQSWTVLNVKNNLPPKVRVLRVAAIYKNESCFGDPAFSKALDEQDDVTYELEDQTIYSIQVTLHTDVGTQVSPCSQPIVVDRISPESPDFLKQPLDEIVSTSVSYAFTWKNVIDRGISGVRSNDTFLFELWRGRDCLGDLVESRLLSTPNFTARDLQDGAYYSARISVYDRASNARQTACSANIQINTAAIGFSLTEATARPNAGFARRTTVDVHTVNDALVGFWCLTPNLAFTPTSVSLSSCPNGQGASSGWHASKPTTLNLTGADGDKIFHLWAANPYGAIIGSYFEYGISLDRVEPPPFTITGITGNLDNTVDSWLRSTVIPTVKWTEPSTAYDSTVRILKQSDLSLICQDGPAVSGGTQSAPSCGSSLIDGSSYVAEVETFDLAGNPRVSSQFAFKVDLNPPSPFSILGVDGGTDVNVDAWIASTQPTVHWQTTSDTMSPVHYTTSIVDVSDGSVCTELDVPEPAAQVNFATTTCDVLTEGSTYKVSVTAYDEAGNARIATNAPYSFRVDLTPPSISWVVRPDEESITRNASFVFTATDALSGVEIRRCKLNTAAWTDCSSESVSFTGLIDGNYTFQVEAIDRVGNSRVESYSWIVGVDLPTVQFTSTPAARVPQRQVTFTFDGQHVFGPVTFRCSLDGATYVTCVTPATYDVAEGQHTLAVVSVSRHAQESNPVSYTWITDLSGPVVTIGSKPPLHSNSSSATFGFSAVDGPLSGTVDHFECSLDGASFTTCTSSTTYTGLAQGSHNVAIRAVDSVTNVGAPATYAWDIDLTQPAVAITGGPAAIVDEVFSGSFDFTAADNESGIAQIECRMDGGSWIACASPYYFAGLSGGSHTFTVRVTDVSGNATSVSYSWFIYTYAWSASGWSGCTASQPSWQADGWSGCSASQPAWEYGGWSGCSASCGGGTMSRSEWCPTNYGSQSRNVWCPTNSGTEARTVFCQRNDGATVSDTRCPAGSKPSTSQSCSRNDCPGGAPDSSQGCSRGGGGDCHSQQSSSQSCNNHSCCAGNMGSGCSNHWSQPTYSATCADWAATPSTCNMNTTGGWIDNCVEGDRIYCGEPGTIKCDGSCTWP